MKNIFSINFNIFEHYDTVAEKHYCFLNMLLLKRTYTKCMYMYEAIFLYVSFMYFWTCTLCRGRNWKEKYFANIVYAVRKRTNHVYPDVSPSVLHHPRQETVFLIINTSTISIYCWLNHKYTTFIYLFFFIIVEFVKPLLRKMPSLKVKTWQRLLWIFRALIVPFYVILKSDFLLFFFLYIYLYSWYQKQISQCWEESPENCGSHEIHHDRKINRVKLSNFPSLLKFVKANFCGLS